MKLDRRQALFLMGATSATSARAESSYLGKVSFQHGVASGDPLADRVILWTRITPEASDAAPIAYGWTLTPVGRRFGRAISGTGVTGPDRDYTVKVDAGGLKPGQDYSFTFTANGVTSPVGQTRTLPRGKVKDVVLAVVSCALHPNGYFHAYGAISALPRVDAVLHLGDYIYEYGGLGSYGMDSSVAWYRAHLPNREIVSLADYRQRHAQYKADVQLQAAHARAPWIVVWDDHETANDSYKDGAENHSPADEGAWNTRKAVAIKAYYEWMPIREPSDGGFAINRSFDFGNLVSLMMLETRLTARDRQLTYDRDLNGYDGKPDLPAFKAKLADPYRRMMGQDQLDWLGQQIRASVASGKTWQVIGNEVVMARIVPPDARSQMTPEAYARSTAKLSPSAQRRIDRMAAISRLGQPYGLDMWDGYPVDRERLYATLKATGARPVVLSGDSHAFWVNELKDGSGNRVAAEFGTTGVTSPGGGDYLPDLPLGALFAQANSEVIYNHQSAKLSDRGAGHLYRHARGVWPLSATPCLMAD